MKAGDIIDDNGNIKTNYGWMSSGRIYVTPEQAKFAEPFGWRQIAVDGELVVIERMASYAPRS